MCRLKWKKIQAQVNRPTITKSQRAFVYSLHMCVLVSWRVSVVTSDKLAQLTIHIR